MPQHLQLERPLAVLDLETTGTDAKKDRIVEICVIKIEPNGERVTKTRRLNPGVPIPAEVTAIHGIRDADVRDQPRFAQVAKGLVEFLAGCDLCGFNIRKFDLQLLVAEFHRVNVPFDLEGRHILDAMALYHKLHPRGLADAVREYLRRDHDGAHGAEADTNATMDVLDAMLGRHEHLPRTVPGLITELRPAQFADSDALLRHVEGRLQLNKGKHRGQPLESIIRNEPGYIEWVLGISDFAEDTKAVIRSERRRFLGYD